MEPCDHKGGIKYWCRDCSYDAATLLRAENERQAAEILAWSKKWAEAEKARLTPRGKK